MGWIESALGLLGRDAAEGAQIPLVTQQGLPFVPSFLDPFEPGGFSIFAPRDRSKAEGGRRRRRRRSLTQGDREDILFISSIVSKAEAGRFATAIVTRSR